MKTFSLFLASFLLTYTLSAQTTLVSYGSSWKYLDNGTNQGTAWRGTSFNDASWASGNAELGYGDGDETTVVSYGPNANQKYITTYFRKTITVTNAAGYTGFTLSIRRDDGAVVYINGTERFRTNMPTGTISYTTRASTDASDDGKTAQTTSLAAGVLTEGTNVIAVEIHQRSRTSSDISFDLQLTGAGDVTPPVVNTYFPADNSADVAVSSNLILTFNETVQKGTGNIIIKEGGIVAQTIDVASASVVVAGNTVTIDPVDFSYSAAVNVEIAAGAFRDAAGNNYAGIADAVTWNFTTITPDITPPSVTNYSPPDDAANIAINANLVLTFSENIQKGAGNIIIKEGGIITQTIDITSASVTVSGNTATINPADFTYSAAVNVEIDPGTFEDLSNNDFAGISDATTWNFTVIDPDLTPPTVTNYSPADDAVNVLINSNLLLTFSENVQKGTGNIIIKEGGVITQTIDVTSASVTVSGNTVTINPADLGYSAAVNIEITAGAFKDLFNNNYAGIADAVTWNFSTEAPPSGPQTFIAYGASWKYLDNGTNQGTAWRATTFNDASWASGNAELGYGDGDETTVVSYGPSSTNKYITTYFRKTFPVTNPAQFSIVNGSVFRDDGIAVYINGTEVYRNNLAAGATYTTLASLASDDGETAQNFTFSPSLLVSGDNVIAVEIHQNAANSSDISMNLQLIGNVPGAALLTRGPYLNMGNGTEITVRWRTDVATNSRVELGTTFGSYPIVINDAASTTEHEVRVTGLIADTKYFYRFGSSTQVLQAGNDNYFTTQPPATTSRKLRFAAFGDCGRNDNGFQSGTLSSYLNFVGANPAEALLLLGDNAYNNGTDAEYQSNYFNVYSANILKNHQLFPAPGNHEYANSAARQDDHNIPYYSIFTNPSNAQSGGVASGTEAYYSWDWGNVHFLSLDSYGEENGGTTRLYDTLGAQAVWVKQDLAANTKPWVVVYMHHPPYTMGSHNSDTESELINMRQNFIRILERMGVDLLLCGHSHDYERSYLLNGYYGNEASFNVGTHALSSSSAKYDGSANSCTYKTITGQNHGTVYVVAGSSGADGGVQAGYPHNAMPWSVDDGGMLYFEVEDNRLDAKFIRRTGVVSDQFTIMKNVNKTTNLSIPSGTPTQLTASWVGTYNWNTTETTRTITVAPAANTTYTVTDNLSCVTDVFNITVTGGNRNINTYVPAETQTVNAFLKVSPTLAQKGQRVIVQTDASQPAEAVVTDINGRVIRTYKFAQQLSIPTEKLQSGIYFIRLKGKYRSQTQKFVVMD
jgi:methionine-rich copper-binding protein CopC